MKALFLQLVRFGFVGALATAAQVLIGWLLARGFGVAAIPANAAGYVCALALSYVGQRSWTFRYGGAHLPAMTRFLVISLSGFAFSNLVIWWVVIENGWPIEAALAGIVTCVPPFTWAMGRLWVFRTDEGG